MSLHGVKTVTWSHELQDRQTFPEFLLKVMFISSTGWCFNSETALFEVIFDDCKLKFIHCMFNITDLRVSLQLLAVTRDHFLKTTYWVKSTIREAGQNNPFWKDVWEWSSVSLAEHLQWDVHYKQFREKFLARLRNFARLFCVSGAFSWGN